MSDLEEIQRLVTVYSFLLDDQRYDALAALFLEDAVMCFGATTLHGPEEIARGVAAIQPTPPGKHLTGPAVVDLVDTGSAHAWADMFTLLPGPDGFILGGTFRYHDRIRHTDAGWRFAARYMTTPGSAPRLDAPPVPLR
ncbi:hypothetical protein PSU4_32000 [Pseudonocardia sulfidoxydans NBRC 16205]|uniref:SnoaL-like domain-containing protein n=1 Tax=Pseudonocardia sulfidoxydans NBRC 16205 TaxID=1223511 RepID=A0A511DHH4_9PSEU|nr:nuclear transport factor 2 family protein [Pseudonocardia sulfidoxydans]GEL24246.1 hypothetical protein PSU4_32000 [Pseudonocardia sulfidoxydans NBRC 16205]